MTVAIDQFSGDYWFLCNFCYSPFEHTGFIWETVEHYFQAMKTTDLKEREKIRKAGHPKFAKRFGRLTKLRPDWEDIKYTVMQIGVIEKFTQNDKLRNLLIKTYPRKLIEGNVWHDNVWGDCRCAICVSIKGQNLLGKILMDIRDNKFVLEAYIIDGDMYKDAISQTITVKRSLYDQRGSSKRITAFITSNR